jgi:hypothetical protein
MGIARNIARLVPNGSGLLPNANIEAVAASKLTGQVPDANAPSGSVIQIVQTAYTTADSTSSTIPTMANTGCTATITPTSASNKVLAMLSMPTFHPSAAQQMAARIMRGSSAAFSGITGDFYHPSGGGVQGNINIQWLDSPATTSAITYTAQFSSGSGTVQINKDYFGNNNGVTYLTLLEIAA